MRADRVGEFYQKFMPSRKETYSHFKSEGIAKSTLKNIMDRFHTSGSSTYSNKRGPEPTVVTPRNIKRKKKKAAKYVSNQEERCKDAARLIYNKTAPIYGSKILIMDDETYCYQDPSQIPGPSFVNAMPGVNIEPRHEFIALGKFEKKYGVWQALSLTGLAPPAVVIDKTMNAEKYLNLCIKPVLLPWMKQNFDLRDCIFWPDMATYHYTSQNVEFIYKDENAPNLPQCRPIETYWGLVKRRMRRYKSSAKNKLSFMKRWSQCSQYKCFNAQHVAPAAVSVSRVAPVNSGIGTTATAAATATTTATIVCTGGNNIIGTRLDDNLISYRHRSYSSGSVKVLTTLPIVKPLMTMGAVMGAPIAPRSRTTTATQVATTDNTTSIANSHQHSEPVRERAHNNCASSVQIVKCKRNCFHHNITNGTVVATAAATAVTKSAAIVVDHNNSYNNNNNRFMTAPSGEQSSLLLTYQTNHSYIATNNVAKLRTSAHKPTENKIAPEVKLRHSSDSSSNSSSTNNNTNHNHKKISNNNANYSDDERPLFSRSREANNYTTADSNKEEKQARDSGTSCTCSNNNFSNSKQFKLDNNVGSSSCDAILQRKPAIKKKHMAGGRTLPSGDSCKQQQRQSKNSNDSTNNDNNNNKVDRDNISERRPKCVSQTASQTSDDDGDYIIRRLVAQLEPSQRARYHEQDQHQQQHPLVDTSANTSPECGAIVGVTNAHMAGRGTHILRGQESADSVLEPPTSSAASNTRPPTVSMSLSSAGSTSNTTTAELTAAHLCRGTPTHNKHRREQCCANNATATTDKEEINMSIKHRDEDKHKTATAGRCEKLAKSRSARNARRQSAIDGAREPHPTLHQVSLDETTTSGTNTTTAMKTTMIKSSNEITDELRAKNTCTDNLSTSGLVRRRSSGGSGASSGDADDDEQDGDDNEDEGHCDGDDDDDDDDDILSDLDANLALYDEVYEPALLNNDNNSHQWITNMDRQCTIGTRVSRVNNENDRTTPDDTTTTTSELPKSSLARSSPVRRFSSVSVDDQLCQVSDDMDDGMLTSPSPPLALLPSEVSANSKAPLAYTISISAGKIDHDNRELTLSRPHIHTITAPTAGTASATPTRAHASGTTHARGVSGTPTMGSDDQLFEEPTLATGAGGAAQLSLALTQYRPQLPLVIMPSPTLGAPAVTSGGAVIPVCCAQSHGPEMFTGADAQELTSLSTTTATVGVGESTTSASVTHVAVIGAPLALDLSDTVKIDPAPVIHRQLTPGGNGGPPTTVGDVGVSILSTGPANETAPTSEPTTTIVDNNRIVIDVPGIELEPLGSAPKRSIFEGASKDEILEYLEDARDRVPEVLMAADDVMVIGNGELIVVNQLEPDSPATPISIIGHLDEAAIATVTTPVISAEAASDADPTASPLPLVVDGQPQVQATTALACVSPVDRSLALGTNLNSTIDESSSIVCDAHTVVLPLSPLPMSHAVPLELSAATTTTTTTTTTPTTTTSTESQSKTQLHNGSPLTATLLAFGDTNHSTIASQYQQDTGLISRSREELSSWSVRESSVSPVPVSPIPLAPLMSLEVLENSRPLRARSSSQQHQCENLSIEIENLLSKAIASDDNQQVQSKIDGTDGPPPVPAHRHRLHHRQSIIGGEQTMTLVNKLTTDTLEASINQSCCNTSPVKQQNQTIRHQPQQQQPTVQLPMQDANSTNQNECSEQQRVNEQQVMGYDHNQDTEHAGHTQLLTQQQQSNVDDDNNNNHESYQRVATPASSTLFMSSNNNKQDVIVAPNRARPQRYDYTLMTRGATTCCAPTVMHGGVTGNTGIATGVVGAGNVPAASSAHQRATRTSASCDASFLDRRPQCEDCDRYIERNDTAWHKAVATNSSSSGAEIQVADCMARDNTIQIEQQHMNNIKQQMQDNKLARNTDASWLAIEQLIAKQQSALVCNACRKRRIERKETISEFVETECRYGRDLRILHDEFYRPMAIAGLLSRDQLAGVFLNLNELIGANARFTDRLTRALNVAHAHNDHDYRSVELGALFMSCSEMLHAFELYCVRQGHAACLLARLAKEKELLRIFLRVSQMENTLCRRMNLAAFLMVPVQRVTKYPLLLNRLYKATPYHYRDREALRDAQLKVELHLEDINQQTKGVGATTKIWRRISNLSAATVSVASARARGLAPADDIDHIKCRKAALELLKWEREETQFVHAGTLHYTPIAEFLTTSKMRARPLKYFTAHALLVVCGQPTHAYRPDLVGVAGANSHWPTPNNGVNEAALVLMREKSGRFVACREPLLLSNCVLSNDFSASNDHQIAMMAAHYAAMGGGHGPSSATPTPTPTPALPGTNNNPVSSGSSSNNNPVSTTPLLVPTSDHCGSSMSAPSSISSRLDSSISTMITTSSNATANVASAAASAHQQQTPSASSVAKCSSTSSSSSRSSTASQLSADLPTIDLATGTNSNQQSQQQLREQREQVSDQHYVQQRRQTLSGGSPTPITTTAATNVSGVTSSGSVGGGGTSIVPNVSVLHMMYAGDKNPSDSFELHDSLTKESFMVKADTPLKTRYWLQLLRYHAKDLGAWRRRRHALANIMMIKMRSQISLSLTLVGLVVWTSTCASHHLPSHEMNYFYFDRDFCKMMENKVQDETIELTDLLAWDACEGWQKLMRELRAYNHGGKRVSVLRLLELHHTGAHENMCYADQLLAVGRGIRTQTRYDDDIKDYFQHIRQYQYKFFTSMSHRQDSDGDCEDYDPWRPILEFCNDYALNYLNNYFKCQGTQEPFSNFSSIALGYIDMCIEETFSMYRTHVNPDDFKELLTAIHIIHNDFDMPPCKGVTCFPWISSKFNTAENENKSEIVDHGLAKTMIEAVRDGDLGEERNFMNAYYPKLHKSIDVSKNLKTLFKHSKTELCYKFYVKGPRKDTILSLKRQLVLLFRILQYNVSLRFRKQIDQMLQQIADNREFLYAVFACNVLGLAKLRSSSKIEFSIDSEFLPFINSKVQQVDHSTKMLVSHVPEEVYYVDGACTKNGKPECRASWAVCAEFDRELELSGYVTSSPSNNSAELTAAIKACEHAKKKGQQSITIVTDTQQRLGSISGSRMNGSTIKKPVINVDLFKKLLEAKQDLQIQWIHVKAHADTPGNIRVDLLARRLIDGQAETLCLAATSGDKLQQLSDDVEDLKSKIKLGKLENFVLENDIVYYIDTKMPNADQKRVMFLERPVSGYLRLAHDDLLYGGYLGIKKTHRKLIQFWWPQMHQSVENYVKSCDTCQRFKNPAGMPPGYLHSIPV
ncbi:Myosin-M heavy chain, partial [Fragariocoptes setiger]